MKNIKILLTVLILLLPYIMYSQLNITGYIETGYLKENLSLNKLTIIKPGESFPTEIKGLITNIEGREIISNIISLDYDNYLYSEINIGLNWKWFTLEQKIYDIFCYDGKGYTFRPLEIMYTTTLYWDWKMLRVGYSHMCAHPIGNEHNSSQAITRRSSYDKIYLRITFSNKKSKV